MTTIQDLKARVDLPAAARLLGVELPDRAGRRFSSPLRPDANPSCALWRSPSGELLLRDYTTGETLDALSFTAAMLRVSLAEALRWLAERIGPGAPFPVNPQPLRVDPARSLGALTPRLLAPADVERFSAAALRLAQDERLCRRLADARGWRAETVRALALEGNLGWEAGTPARLLFLYPFGAKARWRDAAGERVIRWAAGGPVGCLWRACCLHRGIRAVIVTEGETDAIGLVSIGAEADGETLVVALPSAAASFDPEPFRGLDVVLVPDADEAGARCLERLRDIFRVVAGTLRECSIAALLSANGKEPCE